MTITARYENGIFRPLERVAIQDGAVVEVLIPATSSQELSSIRDLGFTGMWARREDIQDGEQYVDQLRNDRQAPPASSNSIESVD